ncbi:MAG: carboxypeptidase regulatory-like domain-containing protein [Candidatus Hydrogenedentes bacterium]|nr:carboxypeptidase regulatory-like domain-containing protein [Candidatus Hydrogenedentota bacterium]
MNSCDPEMVSRYLDGEVTLDEAGECAKHLEACAVCRERFSAFQKLDALAREAYPTVRFRPPTMLPPRRRGIGPWVTAAAVVLLGSGLVWLVYTIYLTPSPTQITQTAAEEGEKPAANKSLSTTVSSPVDPARPGPPTVPPGGSKGPEEVVLGKVPPSDLEPVVPAAPKLADILGNVSYEDERPVSGAEIELFADDKKVASATTGGDGKFRLAAAPAEYVLQVFDQASGAATSLTVVAPAPNVEVTLAFVEPQGPDHEKAKEVLNQAGQLFTGLAPHFRGSWPPLSNMVGRFLPDLEGVSAEMLPEGGIRDQLTGAGDLKLAYTGFLLADEGAGNAFLDTYEQSGPAEISGKDIPFEAVLGEGNFTRLYRLRDGVERFLITDINDASAGPRASSQIPVLWELPGNHAESGGWVLYMDGTTRWLPYPGPFPMTEGFIERLRGLMTTTPPTP